MLLPFSLAMTDMVMFLTHQGLSRTSSGEAANVDQLQITVITTGMTGVGHKSLIRSQMFIRQPA